MRLSLLAALWAALVGQTRHGPTYHNGCTAYYVQRMNAGATEFECTTDARFGTSDPASCGAGMTFYRTDTNVWKVCSAVNTWTALADDDVPEVGDFGALALSGDVVSSGLVTTIQANSVALTTDTTGNYAAGDAEAGAALTGDTATAFFSAGTVEVARLPLMVGDSGAGGTAGLVIAPAVGDSGKYLRGDATWVTVASGSGDVTDVGAGCPSGACWTNNVTTTGTTVMVWEGTISDVNQITITAESNPASAASIALPTASGTLVVSATSPLAVSGAGDLSIGDVALGSGTSGSYAAGDAEAGNATGVACSTCVGTSDVDGTLTAANLAATLTFADSDLIDLSAINDSSATEGLKLPQSTTAGSGTAAGQIHYDNTAEKLYVADGTTNNQIDGQPDTIAIPSTNARCTAGDSGAENDCAEFAFAGSAVYHGALAHTIYCNIYRVAGLGNCGFRVTDRDTGNTLCTSGAITTSTATAMTTCGTVTNVPSGFTSMKWTMTNSDGVSVCAGTAGCVWVIE